MKETPADSLFTELTDYDDNLARVTRDRFAELLLPEPANDEYTYTHDGGFLIFLNKQGCTIRISSNHSAKPPSHHRVLKPLLRIDLPSHFRLEINPGLKLGSNIFSSLRMMAIFNRDKRPFNDPSPRNLGAIPGNCTGSFFDYTVVIDPGAFTFTSFGKKSSIAPILSRLVAANDNPSDIQDRAYADLRDAFTRAQKSGNAGDMEKAWKLCHKARQEKRLLSDWQKFFLMHPDLSEQANKYEQRLTHLVPAA